MSDFYGNHADHHDATEHQNSDYQPHSGPYEQALHYTPRYSEPPRKQKKKHTGIWFLVVALCFSVLGSILGAGGVLMVNHYMESKETEELALENVAVVLEGQRESTVIQMAAIDTSKQMTAAEVYAANVNSTVGITTSVTTNYWGFKTTSAASGSGFIITTDGYILTNYHVIEDSDSISVSLYNGSNYDAELIGYDESNDIAVLKIEAENLPPVILGDSDNLNVGDSVIAIGNPLGELTFSLTAGAVSAKDREVTLSSTVTMNLIQTDCAINSGNSGGALFNLYGEVIGVTNAKYSSSSSSEASIDNIGFAIPINSIWNIVESIIENGYISTPYIGVSVLDVSAETLLYGIPAGVSIQSVSENSPAAEAGLQTGDIITEVNGSAVSSSELIDLIGNCTVGDQLVMTIYRQSDTLEITVTIGEQIQSALANEEAQQSQQSGQTGSYPWGSGGHGRRP